MSMRILLVEDDRRFATALTTALRRSGYDVHHAPNAAAALVAPPHDLVLLDLGLPDADGIDLCRRLRQHRNVAIIMLTARGEESDRVSGLRSGADDYVVKPFSFAELQARMDAVLRRVSPPQQGMRVAGALKIDLDRLRAYVNDEPITLTRKEFQLLATLAADPDVVVRRDRLLQEVWHTSWRGDSRTIDVHVATLRSKIGSAVKIETVRGVGYRLVVSGDPG
jgi:DNA-binding response OmpR family regulator